LAAAKTLMEEQKFQKSIRQMEKAVEELKKQVLKHNQFKSDYAKQVIELVKHREINVGLQTLPYTTGKKREAERIAQETKQKRGRKKRKTTK